MNMKTKEEEALIALVRDMINLVKDESVPESAADKKVGMLLVKMDKLLQKIDSDQPNIKEKADHIKVEIEPKPKKTRKKA